MASPLAALSYVNQVAQILGLENWDLQKAQYNGCSFMTLIPSYQFLNPAAGFVNALESNGIIQQIFGSNSPDPNANLYATRMHLMQSTSKLKKKIVRRSIPNANTDILQNMGSGGFSFTMNAIFNGEDYLQALLNFKNAVFNDDALKNNPSIYKILVHPIWGKVLDVELSDYEERYSSDVFKGVTLNLVFECSNNLVSAPTKNNLANIGQYFNQVQDAIVAISQTISLANLLS